ncbi:MAG: TetR/AcrR family transcriptional regulator [Deltaproteobacteria bacterium]|nr:TetR/AcrR family transcriptional regulator [Deltaproteobacteria bacterium]
MAAPPAQRRVEILDAAAGVFLRYGLRRTSMDDLARAANISRPGLYLYFASKEAVFEAAVRQLMAHTAATAREALGGTGPLAGRVVAAFEAIHGHLVGQGEGARHMAELIDTARAMLGDDLDAHERDFRAELVLAIGDARGAGGLGGEALADLLDLVSVGAKHRSASLDEYRGRLRRGVAAILGSAPPSA